MKTIHLTITGMLAAFLISNAAPALYAEDATDASNTPRVDKFLEKHPEADANGDGKIDKPEFWKAQKETREEKREQYLENHPKVEDRLDRNNDGNVDKKEWNQGKQYGRDKDNNPPGPQGGPGTNWENRPGLQGGPGAGPNRGGFGNSNSGGNSYGRKDFDNNPPGQRGGPGTNWENRPGPQGGPGTGPNRGGGFQQRSGGSQGGGNLRTSGKHDGSGPVHLGGNRPNKK